MTDLSKLPAVDPEVPNAAARGHDRDPAPRPVGRRRPHPLNASVITANFHEPVTVEAIAGNSAFVY